MKKKIIMLLIIIVITVSYFYISRNISNTKQGLTVCYDVGQCKTLEGVGVKDVLNNVIGYPNDYHQAASVSTIDIEKDFEDGRFDEKAFYFYSGKKVYYFINTKILTGFSEDAGELLDSHAKTFEIIDANFSKDKRNVYGRANLETSIASQKIEEADPKTFVTLDFPYAKDKRNVYYLNSKIEGANLKSFQITDNKICGRDINNFYKDGAVVSVQECE